MYPDLIGNPFSHAPGQITISPDVIKRLFSAGKEAFPYEYSAILAGRGSSITHCFHNRPDTWERHQFAWVGPCFIQTLRSIREADLQWLGVVHTHPHTPAIPSAADRNGWHYPALSYWILSLVDENRPELMLYQKEENGSFSPRPYTIS